jgi:hypothetical protein
MQSNSKVVQRGFNENKKEVIKKAKGNDSEVIQRKLDEDESGAPRVLR